VCPRLTILFRVLGCSTATHFRLRDSLEAQPGARVHVAVTRTARDSRGSISSPIWLAGTEPGVAFPETEWSDFPVALLGSWIPAFRRLQARGETADCHFMDGPYRFTVAAANSDLWRVSCFETRDAPSSTNAVLELHTTPGVFLESAISGARALLGYCDSRQWWNDDTERLRTALSFADPERAS